jgi:multidrug efflux pump subunit AcrB
MLTLVGFALMHLLNFQLNPSRALPSISIGFNWPGNEAKVVEQEVTSKLEAAFAQIRGVKDINSKSDNGSGWIKLSLDKDADADAVRFEISMLVRQVWPGLPQGASYPSIQADRPDNAGERAMLTYILNAPDAPQQIMQYADDEIKPRLASIFGVGKVEVNGAEPYEWLIEFNGRAVKNSQLSQADVQQVVSQYLTKEGLGLGRIMAFDTSQSNHEITGLYLPVSVEPEKTGNANLLSLPVKNSKGHITYLSEVAKIKRVEAQALSYYRINGLNTININIFALPGQNQLAVGKSLKQKIGEIQKALPKGFKLENVYDANEYVERELTSISRRFIIGLGLLLFFVFIIYRQLRYMLLIVATFVVNLSIAAIFYYMFKIEIHLYSLAGITVSLGLMTDNIVVMSDHLRNRGNRTVWMAILAGTMAMACTLVVIFFLDEKIKANLTDFALIVIVNQAVSLVTALFFVPSMMQTLQIIKHKETNIKRKSKRIGTKVEVALVRFQRWLYRLMERRKQVFYLIVVLGFGLPVFMFPAKWEGEKWYHTWYNNTLGSEFYITNIKPIADKALGGALRLFVNNVFEGSYFSNNAETSLYITASLPHGSTLQQANQLAGSMEAYLQKYKEIKTFQADIAAREISITVYFKKEYQMSGFPYQLKGMVISRTIELGGAYWGVFGFGDGFSNDARENAGNYSIRMLGYNYETLLGLASKMQKKLMENARIKEVFIQPQRSWYKPDNTGFVMKMDYEKAALSGISPSTLFSELKGQTLNNQSFATIYFLGKYENIRMQDTLAYHTDVWMLNHLPLGPDTAPYRFNKYCSIEKELTAQSICKENQQYSIYLQFDYVGSDKFARKYIKKTVNNFQPLLPLGYSTKDENDRWYWFDSMNKNQYWLLGLIVVMIFFICAILFESLLYPFAVILTIPISFIGIFLTFYLFDLNFDQGGFAAFVLLCGITVSAAIYIINDYSVLRRKNKDRKISKMRLYLKAFQYKIIPILLTVSATALGFVPFLIGEKQPFWFSMAAGVTGGLVFALVGIVAFLPVFLGVKD